MRTNIACGLFLWAAVAAPAGFAQTPAASSQTAQAAPRKPMAFDTVSIRENTGSGAGGAQVYGVTPSGYRIVNLPMVLVLLAAYPPAQSDAQMFDPNSILGMPDWFTRTRYDVDARVGESDMAQWQKPEQQAALLQAMLQQLLAERLKLVVHRENREKSIFELHVGKSGKLTPSAGSDLDKVRETHPKAGMLPGGMILAKGEQNELKLYGATMSSLGALLSSMAGRPIVDKTGLTGKFDITLDLTSTSDIETAIVTALQEQLGLKLEAAKGQVEMLVIDHVEKPSEN